MRAVTCSRSRRSQKFFSLFRNSFSVLLRLVIVSNEQFPRSCSTKVTMFRFADFQRRHSFAAIPLKGGLPLGSVAVMPSLARALGS